MQINVFEGFRRINLLVMLLWLALVGLNTYEQSPRITLSFLIQGPGQIPFRNSQSCGPNDAMEYQYLRSAQGRSVYAEFCFIAHEATDGRMLVPFKVEGDQWIMGDKYSSEVAAYTKTAIAKFSLRPIDAQQADEEWSAQRRWQIVRALAAAAIGLFVIWIAAKVIGWVARGFLGIPKGMDHRQPR